MDSMIMLCLTCLGAIIGMLFDAAWWKRQFKCIASLEHYHIGLLSFIGAALTTYAGDFMWNLSLGYGLLGFGTMMFLAEWFQRTKIKGQISEAHPFAWGSTHFGISTIIGICLTAILIALNVLK
jgi:hypothetical protein